jgi:hypothetical protein
MNNKKIFFYLIGVTMVLVVVLCLSKPIFAGNLQNGSIKVNAASLAPGQQAVINILINSVNSLGVVMQPKSVKLIIKAVPLVSVDGKVGATKNSCDAGTLDDVADDATHYLWHCLGINGGKDDTSGSLNIPVAPTVSIKANGDSGSTTILSGGAVTITWTYTGATSCSLDPASIGSITIPDGSGSFNTNLSNDKTYSITCDGVTKSVTVIVDSGSGSGSGTTFELNIVKSGQGTVTPNPLGSACAVPSVSCRQYDKDDVVVITATPATGRIFTGWEGACAGTSRTNDSNGDGKSDCNVTMNGIKNVKANFTVDPNYHEF